MYILQLNYMYMYSTCIIVGSSACWLSIHSMQVLDIVIEVSLRLRRSIRIRRVFAACSLAFFNRKPIVYQGNFHLLSASQHKMQK